MGMTMIEKILARAAGRDHVEVGEFVVCDVDMTVLIDLQFATMWASPTADRTTRDKLAVIMDHAVPAPIVSDADGGVRAREFARDARHRAVLRRRAARHLPPGDRGERPRPPGRDPDLHRLAHLRRRRLQHRRARSRPGRGVLDHVHRQDLVSGRARPSATSSSATSPPPSPARTSSCTSPAPGATPPTTTSSSAARASRRCR